jgi:hypothetical protein
MIYDCNKEMGENFGCRISKIWYLINWLNDWKMITCVKDARVESDSYCLGTKGKPSEEEVRGIVSHIEIESLKFYEEIWPEAELLISLCMPK